MNLGVIAGLVFVVGTPMQIKHPKACEHAAPPEGMRWVCADENPCDCHLSLMASEDQPEESPKSLATPSPCLACRIAFFVIPTYPEGARQAQKQGIVSASLVLTAEGTVEEVRIQSGDPLLAGAVQSAFRQWRFTPGKRSESIPVSVRFSLSDSPTGLVTGASLLNTVVTATPVR
jgi:TonB family protein